MQRLIVVIFVAALCEGASAQWPQWRGPRRDGVVAVPDVPAAWPAKQPVRD